MKKLLYILYIMLLLAIITGCATYQTTLASNKGEVTTCNQEGFGLIGAVVASVSHANCVDAAKAVGYIVLTNRSK